MLTSIPLFIGGFGGPMEWGVILLIAVLLFGANKIPKLARSSGEAIGEFQKGREEVESELQEMRDEVSSSSEDADASADSESSTDTDSTSSTDSDSTSSS